MKKCILFLAAIMMLLSGCEIAKEVTVNGNYPAKEKCKMIYKGHAVPKGLYRIGSIKVGGNTSLAAQDCNYEVCLSVIETEAAKAGADVAVVVNVIEPNESISGGTSGLMFSGSSCYTVIADLYVYNKNKLPAK